MLIIVHVSLGIVNLAFGLLYSHKTVVWNMEKLMPGGHKIQWGVLGVKLAVQGGRRALSGDPDPKYLGLFR